LTQSAELLFHAKIDKTRPLSMAPSDKLTILLADEDALRRDGLAAVLQGNPQLTVVAQCPDGEAALDQIRRLRPDIAVVDLNLPKMHGIELVRRIRSEGLGAKVVVLSGTADDDIIREVVRAGGDAYLLKNGPARHLLDAISYVRDGGQYFSPQLRRDGLDRRLLEETPRPAPERATRSTGAREEESGEETERPAVRGSRDGRYGRARRSAAGGRDPNRFRERLREDVGGDNLEERDYEILNMMADGIRPILDRLDEIEGRVVEMESGEVPVPGNVRGWLDTQIADTFGDSRTPGTELAVGRSITELEARLPQLIEQAVTNRFHNMATKLQQEIEETHVKTLETFVKNIQVKLVQRVSALETDMAKQAEAMLQLREYSQRTEDNLSRLITGVDRLAQELPRRLAAAPPEVETFEQPAVEAPSSPQEPEATKPPKTRRRSSRSRKLPFIIWGAVVAVVLLVIGVVQLAKRFNRSQTGAPVAGAAPTSSGAPAAEAVAPKPAPPANADTKTKLQAAADYTDRKDYALAEDVLKQVLKAEPNNVEAMKALASVLYREDKIEESAAILDKLPKTN
jgi:DNA-binding NarL/FixJ family response regulator